MIISVSSTLPYPADEVRQLVRFAAKQVGVTPAVSTTLKVTVKRKNHKGFNGWAYNVGWVPGRYRTVVIGLDPTMVLPYNLKKYGRDYILFSDWKEVVVFIAGHELYHIMTRVDREKGCDWHGWYALHQYRQSLGVDSDSSS